MDSQCPIERDRTAGCGNPSVVLGNGGRTSPKPSNDQNQSLNGARSSSGGRQGISSFPPTFSGDEPRPLQTDLFRDISLFYAHLGPEEERERWANYLPEYLRPGNIEKYLEETDKPMLYGNNYWWLSKKNFAQEQQSFNQSSDHTRYSRVQLLEHREVGMCGARREHRSALKKNKEEEKGLVSGSRKEMKKCRALINERKGKKKIAEKKKGGGNVGVKRRLKIQPLLKPKSKPVSHCRHYLNGRCNEGEKCRFSHDVQPLTKSVPCRYFARRSCMKGDDCPYDHNLSKYPCNKYVSTGFCPRRKYCLFSHKVTPNQDLTSTTGITKPEAKAKASNPPPASHSIQRHSQKPHFVFGAHSQQSEISLVYNSSGSIMAESSKGNVPASTADQPVKTPKGLTFLNVENSQKDEQPVPTSTLADVFVFGNSLPHDLNKKNQQNLLPFGKLNNTTFGGGKRDSNAPSNPPALPNSAGVFVFGANSQHDHNKKNQPSLVPFGNHSKTAFGIGKKDTNAPSNSPALPNSSGVFVFGRNSPHDHDKKNQPGLKTYENSSETVFAADRKDAAVPFDPLTLPNSPSVFVFGKSSPLDHNKKNQPSLLPFGNLNKTTFGGVKKVANAPSNSPVLPNSAAAFVFGKNSPHDSNKKNQPSLLPFGNNNETVLAGGNKDANVPSNSPALSAFSARLNSLMKSTSSPGQRFSLSTLASGSSHAIGSQANDKQGTGPVDQSKLVESRVNVHASAGTNSASKDAGKDGGASFKKPLNVAEVWEMLHGKGNKQ